MKADTIDAVGRPVVPESLRDQFHLVPGSELEIEPTSDGVIIRPADSKAALTRVTTPGMRSGAIHDALTSR